STGDRVPTDVDLFRTISRGMPGSAMPSWGHLTEEERWGLVHYVKSFAEKPWVVKPPADPKGDGDAGTGVIRVPPARGRRAPMPSSGMRTPAAPATERRARAMAPSSRRTTRDIRRDPATSPS